MRHYLVSLAVYVALSFAGTAKADLDDLLTRPNKPVEKEYVPYIPQVIEPLDYGLQRRMNQQYQQQQIQDQFDRQQQQLQYQRQQEHMRNNGWGRPGLDGGYGR